MNITNPLVRSKGQIAAFLLRRTQVILMEVACNKEAICCTTIAKYITTEHYAKCAAKK